MKTQKLIKWIIIIFIISLICCTVSYLLMSFVVADINYHNWQIGDRLTAVLIACFASALFVMIIDLSKP